MQAIRNRSRHRLLVPVAPSGECEIALHYLSERFADRTVGVHLLNVQRPVATVDLTSLLVGEETLERRKADGERLLAGLRRNVGSAAVRMTSEVTFGSPAERICAIAQPQRFSGIVIGRRCFALDDLIGRSVIAKILELARVPVTIVSQRDTTVEEQPVSLDRDDIRPTQARRAGVHDESLVQP